MMARPLRSALTSTATPRSDAAWGDDPGELGDVVRDLRAVLKEAMRVRRQPGKITTASDHVAPVAAELAAVDALDRCEMAAARAMSSRESLLSVSLVSCARRMQLAACFV
jgi:predicted oxidoreductase